MAKPPSKCSTSFKTKSRQKKAVYSNLGGGAHGRLGLVTTNAQYALISNTSFFYLNQPDPIIILDGTTAQANSNMRIMHAKEVHLFCKVMGVKKNLV